MIAARRGGYDRASIALHWLVALGIASMVAFGLSISAMARGPDKTAMIQVHKSLGIVVGALALVRLFWRVREGFPERNRAVPAWQDRSARIVHIALLALTVAMPFTGMLKSVTYARPIEAFGFLVVPQLLAEKSVAWNDAASFAHASLAWLLIGLVALHAGAAIKRHVIDRDGTLRRMLKQGSRLQT